ncbi:spectrin alpha non-erythrocytic hypothetical protein [Limosa lapponica baueri]|uniref:EF-hand Ca insensitive domain-containing protein n=1 Tax=Limosa lapponica baueri TaxID=1758121 RepID=A0A2I0T7S2_LIMLA|nr:spectrin alpha non-erythrocytic hypothetical protein [Limosa lapponica baueri]
MTNCGRNLLSMLMLSTSGSRRPGLAWWRNQERWNRSWKPLRDGHVSLQEYMAFMISRETENVKSSEEIESAFRALSSEGKPYVTKEELYQNLTREQADYCISHMKPYMDGKGRELPSAYDYIEFTRSLFVN